MSVITAAPGADVLIVDLARPPALDIATLPGAVLPAGVARRISRGCRKISTENLLATRD